MWGPQFSAAVVAIATFGLAAAAPAALQPQPHPAGSATAWPTPLRNAGQEPAPEPAPAAADPGPASPPAAPEPPAEWVSVARGKPNKGRLARGVLLPDQGYGWVSYDHVLNRVPSRAWRRWGTDRLVFVVRRVLHDFLAAHPELPPVLVGDLSRPKGGVFDRRYGGLGHASHQNGRDVDIYYPRKDRVLAEPFTPRDVDRGLAQELVDRFVAAGAQLVFTGPALGLRGPKGVVAPLVHHDDHLHIRIP